MYISDSYISPWVDYVKNVLFKNGYGYIWLCQGENVNVNHFKYEFDNRLKSQYEQKWKQCSVV